MQYELGQPFQILAEEHQKRYIHGFELRQIHNMDESKENQIETTLFLAPSNNYRAAWMTHLDFVINYDRLKYSSDSMNTSFDGSGSPFTSNSNNNDSNEQKEQPSLESKQDSDRFINDFTDQREVINKYLTHSTISNFSSDDDSMTSNHLDHEPVTISHSSDDLNMIYLDYPESKFSYHYGFGEYLNYWEPKQERSVIPQYPTLKAELINNIVYKLTLSQYYSLYKKAFDLLHNQGYKYRVRAKHIGINNQKFNIMEGEYITINHCISMILYCDYSDCPCEFKKFCRKTHHDESFELFKQRNSQIAHWCRYMKECSTFSVKE